jgi:hypothetical protein
MCRREMVGRTDGTSVETTGDHPFFIQGKGWTNADSMANGDVSPTWAGLKKSGGVVEKEIVFSAREDMISDRVSGLVLKESLAVVDIEVIEEETTVYSFEVEDDHTYFVTEAEVWVHNADKKYSEMMDKVEMAMQDKMLLRHSLMRISEDMMSLDMLGGGKGAPQAVILEKLGKAGADTKVMIREAIEAEEDMAIRERVVKNIIIQDKIDKLGDVIFDNLTSYGLNTTANSDRIESELALNRAAILVESDPESKKILQLNVQNLQEARDAKLKLDKLIDVEIKNEQKKFGERMADLGQMKIIATDIARVDSIASNGPFNTSHSSQFQNEIQSIATFRDSFQTRQSYPDNLYNMLQDYQSNSGGFQVEQNFDNYLNTRDQRTTRFCLDDPNRNGSRICR